MRLANKMSSTFARRGQLTSPVVRFPNGVRVELEWFKNLSALARTGNFSQAAELSHVSQSAFSRRIQALEAWVGAGLVDRSRHPVTLTDAGQQILEASEQAIGRIERERDLIRESLEQRDRYVVTFGAFPNQMFMG